MKENWYTVASAVADMPINEAFLICKDVCDKIKQAKVKETDENKFVIEGKSKASMHSYGQKFILIVTRKENNNIIQVYYKQLGASGGPARKDFIEPLFDELGKRVKLGEIQTETQLIHDYFLDNITGQTKMEEIEQKFHCAICKKNAAFVQFQNMSICNSCFEEKYGITRLRITNAEYHGGHKAYLAGGYFSKAQLGILYLTDNYLIFSKGDNEPSKRWEITIPLGSINIEKWGIEEESRRKSITGGGVALTEGIAIGGGTIHDSGKAHHIVVPYLDENNIPQEPRFGASSIGGKVIRELSAKLYELIVKSKKGEENPSQQQAHTSKTKEENPIIVLKMRLAKGEITKDEFEDLKKYLDE